MTTNDAEDNEPAWAPNGRKIAFYSQRTNYGDLYVIEPDGTGEAPLTSNGLGNAEPAWSPDGTKIIFESTRSGLGDLYVINADGTNLTQLTSGPPLGSAGDTMPISPSNGHPLSRGCLIEHEENGWYRRTLGQSGWRQGSGEPINEPDL